MMMPKCTGSIPSCRDRRQQNGSEDQDRGRDVQHGPHDQKRGVDDEQHDDGVLRQAEQPFAERLGHARVSENPSEPHGGADDEHDDSGGEGALSEDPWQLR